MSQTLAIEAGKVLMVVFSETCGCVYHCDRLPSRGQEFLQWVRAVGRLSF